MSTANDHTDSELAALEKRTADALDLGARRWVLAAAVAVYAVSLLLPFAGDAAGWQVLTFTEPAELPIAIGERAFALLSFLCLVVFTLPVVVVQRTAFAMLAWMTGCVALVMALLGLWLRQTGATGASTGVGMYLAIAALVVAVPILTGAWMRRTPEQQRLEEQRRAQTEFNPVAEVQTDAAQQAVRRTDGSAGIVDDRRQRARERHRQAGER